MTADLPPDQLERLAALDAVHRVAIGDDNIDTAGLIDMTRYVVTGECPPRWPYTVPDPAESV